ncbi:hypothetical protein V6N13_083053 [Hibiscus sabdariffa]
MGLKWRVGSGDSIDIWDDYWLPGNSLVQIQSQPNNQYRRVSELILPGGNEWNAFGTCSEVKVNVDASFVATDRKAITGVVICDSEGYVVKASSFEDCKFLFVPRQGNGVAHALASALIDEFWVEILTLAESDRRWLDPP